jgi:hypothetical protein
MKQGINATTQINFKSVRPLDLEVKRRILAKLRASAATMAAIFK